MCSLGVFLWDATAHEPWRVRYARSYWHLAMPETDLVDLQLEGLRYQRLEPLQRFRVAYEDADLLSLDLEFTGLRAPHEAGIGRGVGHYDQPCHVVGEVYLQGERIPIDTIGMRDRTWSVRPEDRHGTGTAYTYGHVSADEQFLLLTKLDGNERLVHQRRVHRLPRARRRPRAAGRRQPPGRGAGRRLPDRASRSRSPTSSGDGWRPRAARSTAWPTRPARPSSRG